MQNKKIPKILKLGINVVQLDLHAKLHAHVIFGCLNIWKLVIIPPFHTDRVAMCQRLMDTARDKNVTEMIFLSVLGAETGSTEIHRHMKMIEHKLQSFKDPTFSYYILECPLYMEALLACRKKISQEGILPLPLGEGSWPAASTKDVGEAVARLLIEGPELKETYEITGPEALKGNDFAKVLSNELRTNVTYKPVSLEEFAKTLLQAGCTPYKVESLADLFSWYSKGNANRVTPDLENLLARTPTTFTEFVKERAKSFKKV